MGSWLLTANLFFYLASATGLAAGITIFFLSRAITAEKDRELTQYQKAADERIAQAGKDSAEASARVAEAVAEQERLKVRSLELEQKILEVGPRRLSDGQKLALKRYASSVQFKPIIAIETTADPEARAFAEELFYAFQEAGFTVEQVPGSAIVIGAEPGLVIRVDDRGVLKGALSVMAFPFSAFSTEGKPHLFIGMKPAR